MELNTADERSLLIYLETCAVDGGRVNPLRMNDEDREIVKRWCDAGFIEFGRIVARDHNTDGSNWVKFTPEAFELCHRLRIGRAERLWSSKNFQTTAEKAAS